MYIPDYAAYSDNFGTYNVMVEENTVVPITSHWIDFSQMTKVWTALKGKKTYIGLAVGALVVAAHRLGIPMPGVQIDDQQWLTSLWQIAIVAAARHGFDK